MWHLLDDCLESEDLCATVLVRAVGQPIHAHRHWHCYGRRQGQGLTLVQHPPRMRETMSIKLAQLGTAACAAAASTLAFVSSFGAELCAEADLGDTVALLESRMLPLGTG